MGPVAHSSSHAQITRQTNVRRIYADSRRHRQAAEALSMKRADGAAEMVYGGYSADIHRVARAM
jgi:hypothetical protein